MEDQVRRVESVLESLTLEIQRLKSLLTPSDDEVYYRMNFDAFSADYDSGQLTDGLWYVYYNGKRVYSAVSAEEAARDERRPRGHDEGLLIKARPNYREQQVQVAHLVPGTTSDQEDIPPK